MAGLTKAERDALPASAFAVPAKRSFPLVDERHVMMARAQIGKASGLTDDELAAGRVAIAARAEELGIDTSDWDTIQTLRLEAMALDLPEVTDHPNRMPFSGVLVQLDHISEAAPHGSNGKKVVMSAAAAQAALGSLLGMAVNVTAEFDGHDARRKIGVITAANIEGSDLRIEGFIYAADFPEEAARIKADKNNLGFSFEAQQIHVESLDTDPLVITACAFTGAAILKKVKGAFTTTSLAAAAEGEIAMTKEELEAILAAALKPVTDEITAIKASQAAIDEKLAQATKPAPTAEEIAAATAVLDAAGVKIAASSEAKPDAAIAELKDLVADLGTKLTDAIAAKRDNVDEPVRKTLSPQITSLLARAGVTTPEDGSKMKVADVDRMLAAGNLPIGERLRIKQEMSRAGVLEEAA